LASFDLIGSLPLTATVSDRKRPNKRYLGVPIGVELTNLSKRMAGKVDSELGRKIYPQRFAVAEPVSANIRTHKRLDQFTLRGKVKVNIQWLRCTTSKRSQTMAQSNRNIGKINLKKH
jgi:hypothetical protein